MRRRLELTIARRHRWLNGRASVAVATMLIAACHEAKTTGRDRSSAAGQSGASRMSGTQGMSDMKGMKDMGGMPGMTAFVGLMDIGQPKPGETVVVSAASGAVGAVVGQLAKIKGCRAVGIAGGKAKCDYAVGELGFDACIDYKAGGLDDGVASVANVDLAAVVERRADVTAGRCRFGESREGVELREAARQGEQARALRGDGRADIIEQGGLELGRPLFGPKDGCFELFELGRQESLAV